MRRYGERVEPGQTYRQRPGIYAVIHDGRDILVTEQSEPELEFQLPGGGMDAGESSLQALHREVLEETGWKIAVERRLGAYQRYVFMPEYDLWARKVCQIYLCRAVMRLSEPLEPHHRAVWTDVQGAMTLLAGVGDRAFLAQFNRGQKAENR